MDKRKRETDERGRFYCKKCGRWKDPDGFYAQNREGTLVYRVNCKVCMKRDRRYKKARKARIEQGLEVAPQYDPMEWIRELAAKKRQQIHSFF